jgi:NADH dehydrogenase
MSVEDLATITVLLAGNSPTNRTFELGGPDHLSYDQILDAVISALGVWRKKVHVPIPAMIPGVFMMEKVLPNPPVTLQQLKLLQKNNITRPDAVLSTFGFAPLSFAANAGYLSEG